MLLQLIILILVSLTSSSYLDIRGGSVPAASKVGGEYYEKFELDYGRDDKKRYAGSLRGFIKTGQLVNSKEKDAFISWWNQYLEKGPAEELSGRIKPFYVSIVIHI